MRLPLVLSSGVGDGHESCGWVGRVPHLVESSFQTVQTGNAALPSLDEEGRGVHD